MQPQLLVPSSSLSGISSAVMSSFVIVAPPSSGKSTRMEKLADILGFSFHEISTILKKSKDPEVLADIAAGRLASDSKVSEYLLPVVDAHKDVSNIFLWIFKDRKAIL